MEPSTNPARKVKVAWRWVFACEIPGVVLIALAFFLESHYAWEGVSQATMIGIGTALLLAGVLFFFERRFLQDVGDIAAREGAAAAQEEIAASTQTINVRIDQLADQMQSLISEQAAVHDEAVAAMEVPTFDSVASALAHANTLGALNWGHVTVQGSDDPDELGVEFSWGLDRGDGRFSQSAHHALTVKAIVYADFYISGGRPVFEIEWAPDEDALQAGLRLRSQLVTRGRFKSEGTFRWEQSLKNLQSALDLAIRSRRLDPGAVHLHGALSELVSDEWMITEAGLECPGHDGYLYAHDSFPSRHLQMTHREREEWMPDRPNWVDDAMWKRLIERGKRIFPIERGPITAAPSWVPTTQTPAELREHAARNDQG
ncbi:MAG TPA: hypothetical protein VHB02_18400 [Acidimicrobiales bacterium]|nr:hypothetical protein [Acidimicrobiales bacterium]